MGGAAGEAHRELPIAAARNDQGLVTEGGALEAQALPAGIAVTGVGPMMETVRGAAEMVTTAEPAGKKGPLAMGVQAAQDGAEMTANRTGTVEDTVETLSGVLAAASNSVAQADGSSIVLKYHEPPEARKPPARDQWKLFVFKGGDVVDTIDLSLRSCWLVGRDMAVVDLPAEHPSISKQHAVIQFRYTEKRNEYGDKIGRVKPYLIDLESANGTRLNDDKVPDGRYLELRDKDMIQFGNSTREYVVMLAPKD
ncbi:Forkhead-associated (FHA) domain protein [Metarhizium album ARSEF 1941]|uniref:Forkhead-associated (FHA) domain protein n=1 Tax=Metarhizium album (strain ARSEF 1941) TaxID=1081103 RepID=A0A0B2WSY2_METAS|nr:Forkhead-associated (FHA) domain protein [Metarhizium album ARSEF 1941]KHN97143.1 Forkhead-associated (FHA) domain protein [Metarhizium album ARSEF 1941]